MTGNEFCVRRDVDSGTLSPFAGGKIQNLYLPQSEAELVECLRLLDDGGEPYHVVGNCTNVLFGEKGVKHLVKTGAVNGVSFAGDRVTCAAGASLTRLVVTAAQAGLSGLEGLVGIPATVGGGIATNCGSFGTELGSHVVEVAVWKQGERRVLLPRFSYRGTELFGATVLQAVFRLTQASATDIAKRLDVVRKTRAERQPSEPSLGCVWRNVGGEPAARLLEKLNVKGLRVGGAELSRKHCNFIVNVGGATTSDYLALAALVEERAALELGVSLKKEIRILSD